MKILTNIKNFIFWMFICFGFIIVVNFMCALFVSFIFWDTNVVYKFFKVFPRLNSPILERILFLAVSFCALIITIGDVK